MATLSCEIPSITATWILNCYFTYESIIKLTWRWPLFVGAKHRSPTCVWIHKQCMFAQIKTFHVILSEKTEPEAPVALLVVVEALASAPLPISSNWSSIISFRSWTYKILLSTRLLLLQYLLQLQQIFVRRFPNKRCFYLNHGCTGKHEFNQIQFKITII